MKNANWSNYDKDSLDFIYKESTKMLEETFKSFRESSNKSYIALAVYSGMISYCFKEIVQRNISLSSLPYIITAAGSVAAIILLWSNLMPKKMTLAGTEPSKLIHPFFEQESIKDNQLKEMIITKIIDHDKAISENITQVVTRSKRFRQSVVTFLILLFLSLTLTLI
ncbi:MAG TPA: hypothetical protein PLP23_23120 [Panacibacter sp.]|nr:hypothetical protein [Panacibacter sp.]